MPTILVTNDDGVFAPGLLALKQELRQVADVLVLAPERNWSASSHIKTMHKPLRIHPTTLADGSAAYSSSGSPTDCVALAMGGALGIVPDLGGAGVNDAHNLGIDVTYSGPAACGIEAVIKRVPGIAVSTASFDEDHCDAATARQLSAAVASQIAAHLLAEAAPAHTLLSINVPPRPGAGLRVTRMGHRHYTANEVERRQDPSGRPYYWLGGAQPVDEDDLDTDVGAVKAGYVSVTPISLDLTDRRSLPQLREWALFAPPTGVAG